MAERQFGHLRLRAEFEPAHEIGGDSYDFLEIDGERLGILLADVSGKGVPAALLIANLQALFRAQPPDLLAQAGPLLERINSLFHASTAPEHYHGEMRIKSPGSIRLTWEDDLKLEYSSELPAEFAHIPGRRPECGSGPGSTHSRLITHRRPPPARTALWKSTSDVHRC